MTEPVKRAVTAIGDSNLESSITSALIRLGWNVLYIALSFDDFESYLKRTEDCDAVLFYSADIKGFGKLPSEMRVIDVSSHPVSDYALAELIESREERVSASAFKAVRGIPILGVGSLGRYGGASTIALNIAQEIALKGTRTLLIDSHSRNPFAADHFAIYGLNRKVAELSENFSIIEATNLAEISSLEHSMDSIDFIVVECGDISQPAEAINGRRSEDSGFSWIAHNADELLVVVGENTFQSRTSGNPFALLESVAMKPSLTYICNKSSQINRGSQQRLALQIEGATRRPVTLFPIDARGLSAAVRDRSTLAHSAAKSPLRREIIALCDSRRWWGS
jgi:hypothetical protein